MIHTDPPQINRSIDCSVPFIHRCISIGRRRRKTDEGRPAIPVSIYWLERSVDPWRYPQISGAIHSTKIPTGSTGKSGPPQKVKLFCLDRTDPLSFGPKFPHGPISDLNVCLRSQCIHYISDRLIFEKGAAETTATIVSRSILQELVTIFLGNASSFFG